MQQRNNVVTVYSALPGTEEPIADFIARLRAIAEANPEALVHVDGSDPLCVSRPFTEAEAAMFAPMMDA